MKLFLLASVFIIAVCGLVYELLAGTVSSYLVGDSVYQFSLVMGMFMTSMGFGSFLSRYIKKRLYDWFAFVEVMTGIAGGLSSILLFFAFAKLSDYTSILLLVCVVTGTFIGLELPLIIRIMKDKETLRSAVSNVMTADYAGALFASLLFPLVLVPRLGLIRTSLLFGILNILVALSVIKVFKKQIEEPKPLTALALAGLALLTVLFVRSDIITSLTEDTLYKDEIIYTTNSPYQRVVVTKGKNDLRMYINGSIQFSSMDEHRYHEPLVIPAMSSAHSRKDVLIIGGGDGIAAREVLKFSDTERIKIVDIDPAITDFAKNNPMMKLINKEAMSNPKVTIVNDDAWKYLENDKSTYDVIIIDLPDPDNISLSRLYSTTFYRLLSKKLNAGGKIVTQATSPVYSTTAFWCILNTFKAVDNPLFFDEKDENRPKLFAEGYRSYVPSFGEWGFVMASNVPFEWDQIKVVNPGRYLDTKTLQGMNDFPPDIAYEKTEPNTIDTHIIKVYYEKGWNKWSI